MIPLTTPATPITMSRSCSIMSVNQVCSIQEKNNKKTNKQKKNNIINVKRCRDGMPKVCKQVRDVAQKPSSLYIFFTLYMLDSVWGSP